MTRGYCCVALDNPKKPENVGSVVRAAGVYQAEMIVVSGQRFKALKRGAPTDTQKSWRHIPLLETTDVFEALPYNCVPVAVDLVEGATNLIEYTHPERAMYIFGAEDQTLGARVIDRCRDVIMVPTAYCMNLAAAANVVLYDRLAKSVRREQR